MDEYYSNALRQGDLSIFFSDEIYPSKIRLANAGNGIKQEIISQTQPRGKAYDDYVTTTSGIFVRFDILAEAGLTLDDIKKSDKYPFKVVGYADSPCGGKIYNITAIFPYEHISYTRPDLNGEEPWLKLHR